MEDLECLTGQSPTLCSLPSHILAKVCSYLGWLDTIQTITGVNRSLYDTITGDPDFARAVNSEYRSLDLKRDELVLNRDLISEPRFSKDKTLLFKVFRTFYYNRQKSVTEDIELLPIKASSF